MFNNIRINKINALSVILFFINPVLCYVVSLYYFLAGRGKVFFMSLSLAIIFIYFPIMYDTSANFWKVYYNTDGEIFNLYNWLAIYVRSHWDIGFYYFIFLYVFIIFYCWHKSVQYQYSKGVEKNTIYFVIIILFSLNYRDIMDINRNCYAYAVFLFYYFYLRERFVGFNKLMMPLFIFLSCAIHISALLLWILAMVVNVRFLKLRTLKFIFFSSTILGFVLPDLIGGLQGVISTIGGPYGGRILYYLYDSGFAVQSFTLATLLKKVLNVFLIFSIGLICIRTLKNEFNRIVAFILLLCAIALLFSSYVTLFERVSLAITLMYSYVIFNSVGNINLKRLVLLLVITRTIVLNTFVYMPIFIGDYSQVLINQDSKFSLEMKPFYQTTLYLLNIDNGYSDNYLLRNDIWGR